MSITTLPVVHGVVVLLITGLGLVIHVRNLDKSEATLKHERQFYFAVCFMVVIAFAVTLLPGLDDMAVKKLGKFLFLLLVIPLYWYFRENGIRQSALWYGLVLGACVSAGVGVYEVVFDIYKAGYSGRANGATHPIIFGDLALLMGFMSMAGLGWFASRGRWQIVLPCTGLVAGVLASILSLSRGGWVAIPVLVGVLLWASRKYVPIRIRVLGIGGLVFFLLIGYVLPQTGMQQKIDATVANIHAYASAEINDSRRATSIGSRFEMWQASWQIFVQHPLKGVGWGNYQEHARILVEKGERNPTAADWVHPHNQFLSALVSGGILAGIGICLLFFLPLKIFLDVMTGREFQVEVRRMALAGVLLMIGFLMFNLSESFFERSRTVAFFVFYLAICMAGIRQGVSPGLKSQDR